MNNAGKLSIINISTDSPPFYCITRLKNITSSHAVERDWELAPVPSPKFNLVNTRILHIFDNWSENSSHEGFVFLDPSRKERRSWINIISYLEKYVYLKIIYPSPSLESFVKNGFKTQEQIRHNEEMVNLKEQLKNTKCSTKVAFITLLATIVFGFWKQCSVTKIESEELKTIAHSSQNLSKPEPPCITINHSDSVTSANNPITIIPTRN